MLDRTEARLQSRTRLGFVVCFCLGIIALLSTSSIAQDSASDLAELREKWKTLSAQLQAKSEAIKSGTGDTDALRSKYRNLLEQADNLIKKIKTAAVEKLNNDPTNGNTIRTLMGIMLNDADNNRDHEVLKLGDILIGHGINPQYFEIASKSDRLSIDAREIFDELIIRQQEAIKNDLPRVKLTTSQGEIILELFENQAPNTVGNFISLVESGFYNDTLFHRVMEGFMAQTGGFKLDKDGKETGGKGPGYAIKCECYTPEHRLHFTDSLSMAHTGRKDTGGSQFFITFRRTDHLDGAHTCFGRVLNGHDVLEKITRTHIAADPRDQPIPGVKKDKIITAKVIRKRDHVYKPDKVPSDDTESDEQSQPDDQEND